VTKTNTFMIIVNVVLASLFFRRIHGGSLADVG
jgi:hypothetical protein